MNVVILNIGMKIEELAQAVETQGDIGRENSNEKNLLK
jgi:hypothetical protein